MGKSLGVAQMSSIAVVLFSLGGTDKPESVDPYLFNKFNDARIISMRRTP